MASVCEHKYFDYVVLFFILISCIVLAMEEPNIPPGQKVRFMWLMNYILTSTIVLEKWPKSLKIKIWFCFPLETSNNWCDDAFTDGDFYFGNDDEGKCLIFFNDVPSIAPLS